MRTGKLDKMEQNKIADEYEKNKNWIIVFALQTIT